MDIETLLSSIKPAILAWLASWLGPLPITDQQFTTADMPLSSLQFYYEPSTPALNIKLRLPDGSIKTASITLS
jgi:hypothetical protein